MGDVVSLGTGKVLNLPVERDPELLEVLRHYLIRCEKGEMRGLTLSALDDAGHEEQVVVGEYRKHLQLAVNASVQLTIKLARLQEVPGRPKYSGWRPI
jgi:hypothetical protein